MADEATTPQEGNGTPATAPAEGAAPTFTPEQIREMAKAVGIQTFDSSEMHGFKTKIAAKTEAEKSELAAKFDALQAEHLKLAEWKAKQDNQGKSDAELHNEQRRAWLDADKAKDAQLAEAQKAAEALQRSLEKERVQNRIRGLMPDANNGEMALMWAEKYVGKFLSTDESGELVWTDPTGVPHIGVAAEKNFSDWYYSDAQKHLRSGNVPGPVTSGAPSAPTQTQQTSYVRNPALSQMENYAAAEEWDRKHGLK